MADLCLLWSGVLINNQTGCPREKIGDDFDNGGTDLVTVAQMVLPNPDFIERIRTEHRSTQQTGTPFMAAVPRRAIPIIQR